MIEYHVSRIFKPIIWFIDAIGNILFFWTKLATIPKNPKSILLLRLDHIGDVLLTTPVFRALRKKFSSAKITVLVRSSTQELVYQNPYVDEVLVWDAPWFARDKHESWLNTFLFAWSLRTYLFP